MWQGRSRWSTRTSISGIPGATTTRGCATSRRSRSATATTARIRRRYLPADYLRGCRSRSTCRQDGLRRDRMGPAAIRSARCATSSTLRRDARAAHGRRGAGLAGPRRCAAAPRAAGGVCRSCAACATSRAPIAPRRCARRHAIRVARGFARARAATACASICRRRGGICTRRRDWRAAFPDTQIILNHTGLPADRSAEGIAGWRRAMTALRRRAPTWR